MGTEPKRSWRPSQETIAVLGVGVGLAALMVTMFEKGVADVRGEVSKQQAAERWEHRLDR